MKRVLIVDDEPLMRTGLRSLMDWEQLGLSVGECSNGEEALETMRNEEIDILITDIQMPGINGLQLMKRSLQANEDLQVILFSSYNEFAYVQEGIRCGATDYLFKPTLEAEQLADALQRCLQKLERGYPPRRGRKHEAADASDAFQRTLLEHELKRYLLAEGKAQPPTAPWLSGSCVCSCIRIHRLEQLRAANGSLSIETTLKQLQSLFYTSFEQGIAVCVDGEALFAVFPEASGKGRSRLTRFQQLAEQRMQASLTIGYLPGEGESLLLAGLAEFRRLEQLCFFAGTGNILELGGEQPLDHGTGTERDLPDNPGAMLIHENIEQWRRGDKSPMQVKKEASQLLLRFAYTLGNTEAIPELLDMIRGAESLEELEIALLLQFEQAGRQEEGYAEKLIAKAMEYIALRFREEMNLQEVADYIHLSRSYFSLLFKKYTGKKFIEYVIELRIREAKRLLLKPDWKIYEIAEQSGFKDVKYFSKLFKKMTNCTPIEYRERQAQFSQEL